MNNNYDDYAKELLNMVKECITKETKDFVKVKSAIVDNVNSDNTVNIRFPEDDSVWTNILNQSIYQDLKVGDEVKIIEQNGNFKNCWIIGLHKNSIKNKNK